jgi:esterase/lipase superfamily enzyme
VLQNDSARIGATGASFGAFHAANAVFRRPDLFDTPHRDERFYDLGPSYLFGFGNDDVFFNNPTSYLPGWTGTAPSASPQRAVHRLRAGRVGAAEYSRQLSGPRRQGHPHQLDLWGTDMAHDWPTWREMLPYAIAERVGW